MDAVSGMAGATDGIAAVENRTLAGKIIVYPMLHNLGLTPLVDLPGKFPTVAVPIFTKRPSSSPAASGRPPIRSRL